MRQEEETQRRLAAQKKNVARLSSQMSQTTLEKEKELQNNENTDLMSP